jgi:ferric-dicitrate binding protein FerR (iron transport regulator)
LEGEAFFEVAADPERPFIVRTGDLETTVLGTSFNVKAYPKDGKIDVAVKTGKVTVVAQNPKQSTAQSTSVVLSPTEMASYSQNENQFRVSIFDEKEVLSWSDGTLYFNNATMEEFVAKLERWYGVEIVMARKTPVKKGIVGEFKDLSLEEILMGTHEASEFSYEFKNGKVIIR